MKKINKGKEEKGSAVGKIVALGAGMAALATASYYFFGPEGKKNRDNLKSWMIKMKGEIIEKIESAKEVSEEVYAKIVDTVAKKYAKAGKVSESEITAFAELLKSQWKGISKAYTKATNPKKVATKKKA